MMVCKQLGRWEDILLDSDRALNLTKGSSLKSAYYQGIAIIELAKNAPKGSKSDSLREGIELLKRGTTAVD